MLGMQGSGLEGPPPPNPGYVINGPQDPVPIDDDIWVLIAVGIILGIYMVYRRIKSTDKAS